MRIGVIIPDRGDRPLFLANCLRMVKNQTLQPEFVELIADPPKSDAVDIAWRYRTGYQKLQDKHLDLIAFWENDDYYAPDYLETMAKKWLELGKPPIIGTNYTIYYHLKLKKHFTFHHEQRASAMNTLIRPNLDKLDWGEDHDPYCDLHLWYCLKEGKVFKPEKIISVGIKHNVGKVGGFAHFDMLDRYVNSDNGFLKETLDEESYNFYSTVPVPNIELAVNIP